MGLNVFDIAYFIVSLVCTDKSDISYLGFMPEKYNEPILVAANIKYYSPIAHIIRVKKIAGYFMRVYPAFFGDDFIPRF
jgi:hypothetical protein